MIIKGGSPSELVDLAPFPDLVDMPEKENENSEILFCFGESCGKRNVRQVYLLTLQWANTKFEFDVMVIFNRKKIFTDSVDRYYV